MPLDTSVKRINESMRGAPALKHGAGTLIDLLDAFLINGWGSANMVSGSVSGGECTLAMGSGNDFEEGCVVLVAGASPAGVNGEHRLTQGGETIKFEVPGVSDGAVSGSVTVKYAPCGWEKAYSDTNLAVYRSQNGASNKRYLRVADTSAAYARVVGYSTMSDVDTGTGPFPTDAQVSGGVYWHKSDGSTAADQRYDCVGDGMAFLYAPAIYWAGSGGAANSDANQTWFFGDPIALSSAGDAYGTTLLGSSSSWGSSYGVGFSGSSYTYSERQFSGAGESVNVNQIPAAGSSSTSGADSSGYGAFPDGITNRLYFAPIHLTNSVFANERRSALPGMWYVPQSGLGSHPTLQSRDTVSGPGEMATRKFMLLWIGNYGRTGALFVDVSGPWR